MSTLDLSPSRLRRHKPDPQPGPRAVRAAARAGTSRAPLLLAAGLFVLAVYGVYDHGAIGSPAEPRLQVATAALAALAASAGLYTRTLRFAASRTAVMGLVLLTAFAAWSAVTLAWSVAPDLTWTEFNRVFAYCLILALAVALGASTPRATRIVIGGFFALILTVTVYGLGQKALPGFHIGTLVSFNQTGPIARLQQPLGYWNALALLLAMGAPVALSLAADPTGPRKVRIAGIVVLQLVFVTGGFTYSRGGVLALLVSLATCLALSGSPLRLMLWVGVAVIAAIPPLLAGLVSHSLSADGVPLHQREHAGLLLLLVAISCAALLGLAADRLLALERTRRIAPETKRRLKRLLLIVTAAGAVLILLAVTFSSRGLPGTISHLWKSFIATKGLATSNPNRLLSADSANRWVWWKEAAGAFTARPISGWGAGSFPIVHLLYRHDTLSVSQPHSAPLQWLAETGLIGAALAIGAWACFLRASLTSVRSRPAGRERIMAAALLGAVVAYAMHMLYDWDWDFPGVTIPMLILLGVLLGSAARHRRPSPLGPPDPGVRLLALATVTAGLCAYAVSAAVPSIAAGKASAANVEASGTSAAALARAQHEAALATSLDPLSDAGLLAESSIAVNRGQPRLARAYLLQALRRDPSDENAWGALAYLDVVDLHAYRAAVSAAQRVVDLDPHGLVPDGTAGGVAQNANLLEAPPTDDAVAQATPTH